ncbi:MAG TPA: zf-HC2 domain-containing protein [Anaeromyxobacter sp.]
MKECVRFAPMIGSREGELAPDEARALEAHLAGCAACRARAADLAATEGLVSEALLAQANARDFAPFVDEVMARIGAGAPERRGVLAWLGRHRRALAAGLAPALAALAVIVYVRHEGSRPQEIALLEVTSEGDATTILQTSDGPIVLLAEESGS